MRSSIWFPAAIPCARIACMQSRRSDRSAPASSSTRPRSASGAPPASRSSTSSRGSGERMADIPRLSTTDPDFDARLKALTAFDTTFDQKIEDEGAAILAGVRARGDAAVLEYTERFDRIKVARVTDLELSRRELEKARSGLKRGEREALEQTAVRIRKYHERQVAKSWQFTEAYGTMLGQRVTPLERVGMYVPGGLAAYPSSVLMNAIPARIAGVRELIMCVPAPNGKSNPLVLAAAAVTEVDRVFTIGGAQAIAALAYGTQTIPQVDKIVGPGNAWVVAAKRRVFGTVGIDMISGPTEILVICDGSTEPDWIAMDLFSQAEHHETSQAILISPDGAFIARVEERIGRLLADMSRAGIIEKSLRRRGALIKARNLDEACEISNRIAPEHLELSLAEPKKWRKKNPQPA